MPISRKLKIFLNYFLGPVLFIIIGISIYGQLKQQDNLQEHWNHLLERINGSQAWQLYLVIGLMTLNWSIESLKWKVLLQHIVPTSFSRAVRSVISGLAFTMITPNRMGEFIGRVFIVPDGSRIRAAGLTFVGSISQLLITLLSGAIGLFFLRNYLNGHSEQLQGLSLLWISGLLYVTGFIFLLVLAFYFNIGWMLRILEKIPPFSKYAFFMQPLEEIRTMELLKILLLSGLRYSVFLLQYWLLLGLFEVNLLAWQALTTTTVMFLILAIVPTIALAEIGIRSKVSIALFGIFSQNTLGILAMTASIWLINIIFPAIAGSLFVLSIKLFRKA